MGGGGWVGYNTHNVVKPTLLVKVELGFDNNLTSNRVLTYFKLLVYTKKLGGFVARACSTGSSTGPKFSNVLSLGRYYIVLVQYDTGLSWYSLILYCACH